MVLLVIVLLAPFSIPILCALEKLLSFAFAIDIREMSNTQSLTEMR